jgi:hypothetical protein
MQHFYFESGGNPRVMKDGRIFKRRVRNKSKERRVRNAFSVAFPEARNRGLSTSEAIKDAASRM